MPTASSHLSEENFLCSICIDVVTDPITTPCGHNHCKSCIRHYWDVTGVCQCPLCKETFHRQEFSVNKVLSEMADRFRQTQRQPAEPDEVSCGFCSPVKIKALKTCLVCQISYCETHLESHQRVTALRRHTLIDPVKNLQDFTCKEHDRPLELFCKTDRTCVCQFCAESNHESHQIVSLGEECEGMKAELGKTEAEVQQMVQERHVKIQEVKRSVELSRSDADRDIADTCVQFFTALMNRIEKHKTGEKRAAGFIKELQEEITQLEKRISELKQLSHSDLLHLLQNFTSINAPPPTKDWTNVNVHESSYVGTVWTTVAQLEKILSEEMRKLYDAELRRVQRHEMDVTLDPDTAHYELILSKDGKQASYGGIENDVPDNKERFSYCACVLGKQSFFTGRFYYEVQVKGTEWDLGVARGSINRKGQIYLSQSPLNGYWTIGLRKGNEYKALADPCVLLPVREKVQTVGVFVDYEEGLVSFHDVQARVHLYSFTGCTFGEKLYPLLSPSLNDGKNSSAPLIIHPVNHIRYY